MYIYTHNVHMCGRMHAIHTYMRIIIFGLDCIHVQPHSHIHVHTTHTYAHHA